MDTSPNGNQNKEQQEQAAAEAALSQPVVLTTRYTVTNLDLGDGRPGIMVTVQTPVYFVRVVGDNAFMEQMADAIKRACGGTPLVIPPAGFQLP